MSSPSLSRIPAAKRRRLAATLGLFAVLFVAVGAVAATGAATTALQVFVGVALAVAIVLALMAWGVAHSIRIDAAERDLEAAVNAIVTGHPATMCTCGHDHDPTEMHVSAGGCDHDGAGDDCSHSCETCVLASLRRPAPDRTRAERASDLA